MKIAQLWAQAWISIKHRTLPALKITPKGLALEDRRLSLHSRILLSNQAFFPPSWDVLLVLNVALANLKSGQLTRSGGERPATPTRVKVAQIWTFSSANARRAHQQTSTVSFKQAEKKKQSFKAMLGQEVPQKSRESNASCMIKRPGCPKPGAQAEIVQ